MSTASSGAARVNSLAKLLMAYMSVVVAIGVLLPTLALLERKDLVHLEWLSSDGPRLLPWAIFIAACFLLFRNRIRAASADVAKWLLDSHADRYRWVVVGCCLLIFTSYSWQLHIGIAHRGVPGWVYRGITDVILPDPIDPLSIPEDYTAASFAAALRPAIMPYVRRSGYASSEVIFLHFKDGSMRPANYALALVSWPLASFGVSNGQMKHPAEFLAIIKHNFANRRAGAPMLLPTAISYPSHLNYQYIDYSNYPPVDDLVGVSLWKLTAHVDVKLRELKIVGAKRVVQVFE